MQAKNSDPIPLHAPQPKHRQAVLALRDLLVAADKHNTGGDHELASAYHQARKVLAINLNILT